MLLQQQERERLWLQSSLADVLINWGVEGPLAAVSGSKSW